MPTGLDRCIQPARSPEWDTTFSDGSEGFRPGRAAHQAIAPAQRSLGKGSSGVVDLDRETCFDRVNHDKRRRLVKPRVADRRV
jgi:RNA-directed DNA polymerase